MFGTQVTTGEISRASESLEGTPLRRGDSMKAKAMDTGRIERNPDPTVTGRSLGPTEKSRGPTERSRGHTGMNQAHTGTMRGPAETIRGPTETIHGLTGTIRGLIRNPATLRPLRGPAITTRSDRGGQDQGRGRGDRGQGRGDPSSPGRPSARRTPGGIRFGIRRYASNINVTQKSTIHVLLKVIVLHVSYKLFSFKFEATELGKKIDKQEKKGLHYLDMEEVDVRRAFRQVFQRYPSYDYTIQINLICFNFMLSQNSDP